ncbi:hypothetical protein GCM10009000_067460 [Halobacterium noricense]
MRTQFLPFQLTLGMKLFEVLMNWQPLYLNRIRNPPSGHSLKLGLTNLPQNIAISDPTYWSFFNYSATGLL